MSPVEATKTSMRQITGAVIATTLVTVAIYVPICFYGGMVGEIYKQFGVTMCIALCLSTVNALTLSPALCAMFLKPAKKSKIDWFGWFNKPFNLSRKIYLAMSRVLVRSMITTLVLFAVVLFGNYKLYSLLPTSFVPGEDKGTLMCSFELPPGATLARTDHVLEDFYERINGEVEGVDTLMLIGGFSFTGGGQGENVGMAFAKLDDWSERTTPELQIGALQQKIQSIANDIPEAKIQIMQPPAIMGLGMGVSFVLCSNSATPQELADQV